MIMCGGWLRLWGLWVGRMGLVVWDGGWRLGCFGLWSGGVLGDRGSGRDICGFYYIVYFFCVCVVVMYLCMVCMLVLFVCFLLWFGILFLSFGG